MYEPVLCALSVDATVCKSMELAAALDSVLWRKYGGDVTYLESAVGPSFFTPHIDVARVRDCFDDIKNVSADIAFITGGFPWRPGRRGVRR